MSGGLTDRTPAGVLAYCDYLMDKGYATASQVNPWKTAIQKVFETVEGEGWESLDIAALDFEEYTSRFRTLAGAAYKAESVSAYARRIRNALDAHDHYLSTGRPPTFRAGGKRAKTDEKPGAAKLHAVDATEDNPAPAAVPPIVPTRAGMMTFSFPLGDGQLASLTVPPRMKSDDVNRLSAFLRTLQDDSSEQRQIPRRSGEEQDQAA
jgi:GH24 family phage-related lysozyme (muramidase)